MRLLSDEEIATVAAELNTEASEIIPAFNFLIESSANVLAAEIILEKEWSALEERVQSALSGRRQK